MMVIGLSTFRELIRQRLIHIIFFLSMMIFALSLAVGSLSIDEESRLIFHFGFSAIQIGVVGISLLLGSSLIPKEIDRQTCLIVLARPIDRVQFFFGKWFGVALLNLIIVGALSLILWPLVGIGFPLQGFLKVGAGVAFESLVLLSLAFWGSQFLRPAISLFFSLGIFLLGHWLTDLSFFAAKSKSEIYISFSKLIHAVVPQLYRLDWKSFYLVEKSMISNDEFFSVSLHALGWTLFMLILGAWSFRRKDLV